MTSDHAIATRGLSKHFGSVKALDELDLEVERGEVFGFLGPNGAGKSTMIRLVLDELHPTAGSTTMLGFDCHRDSVELRRHLGYLPGDLAMYPNLTGHDTLTFFANLRGGVDWTYVHELADRLGADLSRKVGDLSTGNRQKIGLIQAFMNQPELLIMDEPSTGLDPLVQREFQTMLREIVAEGRSVFLSSHTLAEVQRVADRVAIIRHGRLVAVEAVANLRSKAIRKIEIVFDTPTDLNLSAVEGVREVTTNGASITVSFDGDMKQLLGAINQHEGLIDIATEDADLEEVFLAYYRDEVESA